VSRNRSIARDRSRQVCMLDITSPTRWHQCKQESYEGTQLRQIKYIVNYAEQTTEGIQATYMELLVRRVMKRVPGPISCLRLPGTLQHCNCYRLSERFENCHNGNSANATALLSIVRRLEDKTYRNVGSFVKESRIWTI